MKKATRTRLLLLGKIIAVIILLSILIAIIYWYYQGQWRDMFFRFKYFFSFTRLRDFILSFGAFSAIVFIMIQALQVVFAPIPGEVTGFIGGYLYGKVLGVLFSTVGLTFGSFLAFEIARVFGTALVKKVVKQEAMERFDYFVTHRGVHIAFILFLVPGFPKDSLCYLLGLTHLRRIDFLLMNVFGRLPGTLILNLEGDAVRSGKYQAFFILLAASVVLTVLLYFLRGHIIRFFSWCVSVIFKKKK
jgi:uncharacterized membrane protein YdjX (TVP38/TMEM64 family)